MKLSLKSAQLKCRTRRRRAIRFSLPAAIFLFAGPALAEHASANDVRSGGCVLSPREVVEEFAELFYRQKNVRLAFKTWVHPDYIQHKPTLANGRGPAMNFLKQLFENYPERRFTIHRMIASEGLVAVHYHSQANEQDSGMAIVDIFRVENCQLVEHWDVVQPVPARSANENTMF